MRQLHSQPYGDHPASRLGALLKTQHLRSALLLAPIAVWLGVFLIAPLVVIFLYSLWRADATTFTIVRDFNLEAYDTIISSSLYLDVLLSSLWVGLMVVVITMILGYPLAYLIASRKTERAKIVLLLILLIPFWTSVLLRSYAWLLVLGESGAANSALQTVGIIDHPLQWLLFSKFAVVVSLVQIYLPFMVLSLYVVLERFDWGQLEAAWDLGAGKFRTFLHILIPASMPGFLFGTLLVFIPAAGSYLTPSLVGGASVMYSGLVSSQFGLSFNWPLGAALAFLFVAALAIVVTILMKIVKPWESFERGSA